MFGFCFELKLKGKRLTKFYLSIFSIYTYSKIKKGFFGNWSLVIGDWAFGHMNNAMIYLSDYQVSQCAIPNAQSNFH